MKFTISDFTEKVKLTIEMGLYSDEIEDQVEDVKEAANCKKKSKRVKEEVGDVVDAIKEVGNQSKDVKRS